MNQPEFNPSVVNRSWVTAIRLLLFDVGFWRGVEAPPESRGRVPDITSRNPNLRLPRTSHLESFRATRVYKTRTSPPSGALRPVAGKYCLPDARN